VIENLDLRPSQSPGIGRSNLAPISNSGDDSIAPIAGAFAPVLNQIFSHVGYKRLFLLLMDSFRKLLERAVTADWVKEMIRKHFGDIDKAFADGCLQPAHRRNSLF